MQPIPQEGEQEMLNTCLLLNELSINYRLTDGTALGLHRDGRFIPHDNDIDIDILDIKDYKELLKKLRTQCKYKLGGIIFYKGIIQQMIFYSKHHVIIDLIFWSTHGNYIYNYVEKDYERKQPHKYFTHLCNMVLHNVQYPGPGYINEWMELRYGKDWKIPKTYKGDWKEECEDRARIK
jgi:hypothetical protein